MRRKRNAAAEIEATCARLKHRAQSENMTMLALLLEMTAKQAGMEARQAGNHLSLVYNTLTDSFANMS